MYQTPPNASRRGPAALRVAVFFVGALFAVGCLSVEQMGDRAFEAGNHKEAQTHYEQAIAEGSEDPQLYRKAARNELELGNLASAEKYFTRALKFGGGDEIAKELARFYVQTSNYVSAVRVYQYLLYQVPNPQPVYNNLGTALIYAGKPFDAESHLLVAQQMDPQDPLPYLNLGLLYDQHLKQPWLAVNFYDCFVELSGSGQGQQQQQAMQRSRELQSKWAKLYDRDSVVCGKVYEPRGDEKVVDLKEAVGGPVDLETASAQTPEEPADVIIERMVESLPKEESPEQPKEVEPKEVKAQTPSETSAAPSEVTDGRRAFAEQKWEVVIERFTSVALKSLQPNDLAMLGASYYRLKKFEEAAQWLEMVSSKAPNQDNVMLLIDAHVRRGDVQAVANTCDRFRTSSELQGIAEHCEKRITQMKEAVPKTGVGTP